MTQETAPNGARSYVEPFGSGLDFLTTFWCAQESSRYPGLSFQLIDLCIVTAAS